MRFEFVLSRAAAGMAFAALIASSPAGAQAGWKEYEFSKDGFAARYPGQPVLAESAYETKMAPAATERVYSFDDGGIVYAVAITDLEARGRTATPRSTKPPTG